MNFSELESLMSSSGVTSLADIARALNTTPQAVSNWKSRNQVPHHIVANLNKISQSPADSPQSSAQSPIYSSPVTHYASPSIYEEDTISLSDILLTLAEQLKVIVMVPFVTVFLTFTYVQFIQQPLYESWATVLLPSSGSENLGGLAGIASQFGVSVPTGAQTDLSSPTLFPELLRSRTFAEIIMEKEFYSKKHGRVLPLLAILTYGDGTPTFGKDTLVTQAIGPFGNMVQFNKDPSSAFSVIKVTTQEPVFSKELAEVIVTELGALNRFYKIQTVNEKTIFIEERISSVKDDLEQSEQTLKSFREQNRQISSPALQLEQERLTRDVEIQKNIFLTLKQQLELAKIEEVQKASIVQVVDKPQVPLGPSNKNLKLSVLLAGVLGFGLGIMLGFVRAYTHNSDMDERKKLRRVKHFFKKKAKDIILDRRVSGIVSILLLIGLPFYLGHESQIPVYLGMYSAKYMLFSIVYVITLITSIILFIYFTWKKP